MNKLTNQSNSTQDTLRHSVEIETRSDLFAASGNLREASLLMREANKLRASVFGKLNPNELRERTHGALLGKPVPLTKEHEQEMRELTADTIIDKENDRIVGDVGLGAKQQ